MIEILAESIETITEKRTEVAKFTRNFAGIKKTDSGINIKRNSST